MSFNPKKDGSKIWTYMHLMAANATSPVKREHYVYWLNSLQDTFPCELCRKHLIANLDALPVEPYSATNVSLFYHSWKLHDTVNGQLNKPMNQRLTYEEAFEIYFPEQVTQQEALSMRYAGIHAQNEGIHAQTAGMHQMSLDDPTRHIVAAGRNVPAEDDFSHVPTCNSCGSEPVESSNRTYVQYQQAQRRRFNPKN